MSLQQGNNFLVTKYDTAKKIVPQGTQFQENTYSKTINQMPRTN